VAGKRDITADTALRLALFFWRVARLLDEFAENLRT
jgi:plasmid maintenance system antidote protein VapI